MPLISPKFLLIFGLTLLISFCPFLILLFTLVLGAVGGTYFQLLPVSTLTYIYALLPAGYLLLFCISLILDILRFLLSGIQIPWKQIVIIELLALSLFFYNYKIPTINKSVHLPCLTC